MNSGFKSTCLIASLSGIVLGFAPSATAQTFMDFEGVSLPATSGSVLFRNPTFSGSTFNADPNNASAKIDPTPNLSQVVDVFPAGNSSTKVIQTQFSFRADRTDPWLRLTTSGTPTSPNPTIDFNQNFSFDIYSDRPLSISLGVRETGTTAAIGASGGTSGSIEWVGASGKNGQAPIPTRTVPAGMWTTLTFDLDAEPMAAFTGNAVLDKGTSGKGVFEHLAIVPLTGDSGTYTVYFDNFTVTPIPEPTTVSLGLLGLAAAALLRRKK